MLFSLTPKQKQQVRCAAIFICACGIGCADYFAIVAILLIKIGCSLQNIERCGTVNFDGVQRFSDVCATLPSSALISWNGTRYSVSDLLGMCMQSCASWGKEVRLNSENAVVLDNNTIGLTQFIDKMDQGYFIGLLVLASVAALACAALCAFHPRFFGRVPEEKMPLLSAVAQQAPTSP